MNEDQKEIQKAVGDLSQSEAESSQADLSHISKEMLDKGLLPKNALGLSDNLIEGIYGQAYRLYNTGKYKESSQLFRMLIMIDATEPKYSMGLAACFHMMKEYQNAINTYAICGIMEPDSPIPHYHSSDCYLQMNDPISAAIALEMAIKRASDRQEFQALKDRATLTLDAIKKKQEASKK